MESLLRVISELRSSSAIVMSATSLAMAAPSLTAMPTLAAESAGESLMPSPTIMTLRPSALSLSIYEALSSGSTSER